MRMKWITMPMIIGVSVVAACSSATEDKPLARANVNVTNAVAGNANAVTISNGAEIQAPVAVDPNAAPAAASDRLDPGNRLTGKFGELRKAGGSATIDAATLAKQTARPAPDNSTFSSYLTDAGYEVRTFKSHSHLLKVEKKLAADGKQTVKVFLRNGKVVDLPGQSLSPLATVSADSIMQAAGVQVQPVRPSGPVPTKKSGE